MGILKWVFREKRCQKDINNTKNMRVINNHSRIKYYPISIDILLKIAIIRLVKLHAYCLRTTFSNVFL